MTRNSETTHKIMSAVHSKNTKPEILLCKALWNRKVHFRKNPKKIFGKPDIALTSVKVAIFCDGDFWHGHNWAIRGYGSLEEELKKYSLYWQNKIKRNIVRDAVVTKKLQNDGWIVLRFWASDIMQDATSCANKIADVYFKLLEIE